MNKYFETLDLKESGVVQLVINKTCKVHGIRAVQLKMFDNLYFLLCNVRYVPEPKLNLLSISRFHYLNYCTRIEHDMWTILLSELMIVKGSQMCSYNILNGFTIIVNASLTSQYFHDKPKL